MRIAVTGGSGFIGAALVKRLVSEGHDVVVFDNNSRGALKKLEGYVDRITFVEGDVRDRDAVEAAVDGCDVLYHLAFVNGTRYFYEEPRLVLDVGVKGAINTVEAAVECSVERYILASSSEVYHHPPQIPTAEDVQLVIPDVYNPRYSYAGGKLISELIAINYLRGSDVRLNIFRPHNVFGPDMGFEHVIPEIMGKLRAATDEWQSKQAEIQLQGTGTETRAFCYVDDAVDQVLHIQQHGEEGELYHVGQNHERTIASLIGDIASCLDIEAHIVPGAAQSGGTPRRCPDVSKLSGLGYTAPDRYAEGLAETVNWYRRHTANGSR